MQKGPCTYQVLYRSYMGWQMHCLHVYVHVLLSSRNAKLWTPKAAMCTVDVRIASVCNFILMSPCRTSSLQPTTHEMIIEMGSTSKEHALGHVRPCHIVP